MTTTPDVARCQGITEHGAAFPIKLCKTCACWKASGDDAQFARQIVPAAVIRVDDGGWRMHCDNRVPAEA